MRNAILSLAFLSVAFFASADTQNSKRDIYDETAVGTEQIAAALQTAQAENKRVLLQFGANWCVWCHRLHELYQSDAQLREALEKDFVVVLIDVNKGHNSDVNDRYGNPTKLGLPVIVVLDKDGSQLATQNTGDLEDGPGHDPQKVLAFLQKWSPHSAVN